MQPPPLPPLRRPPVSRANGAASIPAPASSAPQAAPASHTRPTQSPALAPDATGVSGGPLDVDSALHTLSPEFLAALRKVVPRKRRAKLPYIVGLGLLAVVVVVGVDPQTREFLATRSRTESHESKAVDSQTVKPAPVAPPADTVVTPTNHPAASAPVPAVPWTVIPPASVASPKKAKATHPRPAPGH